MAVANTINALYGTNKVTGDKSWAFMRPGALRNATEPIVCFCHDNTTTWDTNFAPDQTTGETGSWKDLAYTIAANGFLFLTTPHFDYTIAPSGANVWETFGNAGSLSSYGATVQYARRGAYTTAPEGLGGHPTNKVILIGHGMGFLTAANYYRTHTTQVAGIVGIQPVTDLTWYYANAGAGQQTAIQRAFGFAGPAFDGTVQSTYDPTFTPANFVVPTYLMTHLSDTTTGQSQATTVTTYHNALSALGGADSTLKTYTGSTHTAVPGASVNSIIDLIGWLKTFGSTRSWT